MLCWRRDASSGPHASHMLTKLVAEIHQSEAGLRIDSGPANSDRNRGNRKRDLMVLLSSDRTLLDVEV